MRKLQAYGISGKLIAWIEEFLTGRRQQVVINGTCSDWAPVSSGVPQGSVLGPLLFVIYINDLPDMTESAIKIFADDTKIYQEAGQRDRLQADLDRALMWSEKWQLPFNEDKCHVLHIGSSNPLQSYSMRGKYLEEPEIEKDLGVLVD